MGVGEAPEEQGLDLGDALGGGGAEAGAEGFLARGGEPGGLGGFAAVEQFVWYHVKGLLSVRIDESRVSVSEPLRRCGCIFNCAVPYDELRFL